jgi:hypothetical protein
MPGIWRWTVGLGATVALIGAICLVSISGCTEARLKKEAPEVGESFDDKLRVEGRFCTEPTGEVTFPIKVLFILDQSASLQCMDSGNRRIPALRSAIDELRSQRHTQFAFIGFSSWSRATGFTRDRDDIADFLDPDQGLGPATDYQGVLATAISLIEEDMLDTDPAERARTRYQVVFVSDGVPEPKCSAGCDDDDRGVCNTDQEIPEEVYVDMSGVCPDYNQPAQIRRRIEELVGLPETYSAGGLVLHSVLLFSPQDVVEQVCPGAADAFGYERDEAESLLREMARQGNGTFRDVNLATEDDSFLQFGITSISAPQTLTSMMATNNHARRHRDKLMVDSDQDGLVDEFEYDIGTDPFSPDTDGDGYGDLFEYLHREEGFDPLSGSKPAVPCDDADDRDGDGLKGCEERYLGTSTLLADTDGDDMFDWHELVAGTDPLVSDADGDLDFDGIANGLELRAGTDAARPDEQVFRTERVVYGLDDLGLMDVPRENPEQTDERRCYDFEVERIPLVVTPLPRQRGLNRILLYTTERPARVAGVPGRVRVACFEAFYDGSQVKTPASGRIDISQEALDQTRKRLGQVFEDLQACEYFEDIEDDAGRSDIEEMLEVCMPRKVALEGRMYPRDELIELLQANLEGSLQPRLPLRPDQLFVPLANFRADRDCFRPWEFDLLELLADTMNEACSSCERPEGTSNP